MSKCKKSHARTQNGNPQPKRPWYGQDNLKLKIGNVSVLAKWMDVDEWHHPVKDYIAALKNLLWNFPVNGNNIKDFNTVKSLAIDLIDLDLAIDTIMEKGGLK